MDTRNDYTGFSGRQYLNDYFSTNGKENKFLMKFLHESYLQIPKSKTLIEIGGGPTIYQILSAREKAELIIFTDIAKNNLKEINWFRNGSKESFDWRIFAKYVLELEGKSSDKNSIEACLRKLRTKISNPESADIRMSPPTLLVEKCSADILSMHSVPETVTNNETDFVTYLENALTLLHPGGYYTGMFVKNQKIFTCGCEKYEIFPVNEAYLKELFPKIGLKQLRIESVEAEERNSEYEGLISILCQKV